MNSIFADTPTPEYLDTLKYIFVTQKTLKLFQTIQSKHQGALPFDYIDGRYSIILEDYFFSVDDHDYNQTMKLTRKEVR